jgi:hypothetical protein
MAEWLKAAVLKTAERQRSVGSNPTPSARLFFKRRLKDSNRSPPPAGRGHSFEEALPPLKAGDVPGDASEASALGGRGGREGRRREPPEPHAGESYSLRQALLYETPERWPSRLKATAC